MILERWITHNDIAAMIREAHSKGYDMAEICKAADEARSANDLKAAAEAVKAAPKNYKTIAVAYRKPGEDVKVAQGIQWSNGTVHVEDGHGVVSGREASLNSLRHTVDSRNIEHHIVYTDET